MKSCHTFTTASVAALLLTCLSALPGLAWATSLAGDATPPGTASASSPKDNIVKKYFDSCRGKSSKEADCDTLKKDAIDILKEDLHTLGSSADRTHIPAILTIFKSDEPELRIAAADAMGMIGPQNVDIETLASVANDPVPDVRRAVAQMLQHGKGGSLSLLSKRVSPSMREGRTPETPPDPGKYAMPVSPGSTYLFFTSDVDQGRLSFVAGKGMKDAMAFFKNKAKRGPFKLEEFQRSYRDQLDDEQNAREAASDEMAKQMETVKPDPANMEAYMQKLRQVQSVMASKSMMLATDMYPPDVFGSPMVYVLEERQIGNRSYPTRYVVLYQDQALRRPGFRLCWMTASDQAIKSVQATSMMNRKREEAQQKREEAQENMVKKRDEQEKKKFKKGQADLEKELGF